ncbi:unnamed protein product [Fusarium equiseti]|uniref:Uncharacterized protein n=1 Tax=Fusarium equiseti TaxID=61235 RepID=A0A8J2IP41_FUSEQ|nr:unnamed protein product [Fusarium equiseti]
MLLDEPMDYNGHGDGFQFHNIFNVPASVTDTLTTRIATLSSDLQGMVVNKPHLKEGLKHAYQSGFFTTSHFHNAFIAFFRRRYYHRPPIHWPTFHLDQIVPHFLLAVILTGTAYLQYLDQSPQHFLTASLLELAEKYIFKELKRLADRNTTPLTSKHMLEICQAAVLMNSLEGSTNHTEARRRIASKRIPTLVAVLRKTGVVGLKHAPEEVNWEEFVHRETCLMRHVFHCRTSITTPDYTSMVLRALDRWDSLWIDAFERIPVYERKWFGIARHSPEVIALSRRMIELSGTEEADKSTYLQCIATREIHLRSLQNGKANNLVTLVKGKKRLYNESDRAHVANVNLAQMDYEATWNRAADHQRGTPFVPLIAAGVNLDSVVIIHAARQTTRLLYPLVVINNHLAYHDNPNVHFVDNSINVAKRGYPAALCLDTATFALYYRTTRIQSGNQNARDRSHPADNSDKFTDDVKGKASQDKTRQKAKEDQGALQCDNTWFRASIRSTDYFQS